MSIAESLIKVIADLIAKRLTAERPTTSVTSDMIATNIEKHLVEVANWSRRIQFFGISRGEETDAATIALKLHTEPRRFRLVHRSRDERKDEDQLLTDEHHYVLLGDPGAGKTTTLKRLALHMLKDEASNADDIYQYPIVIRLRELRQPSITVALAEVFGIPYVNRGGDNFVGDVRLEAVVADALNETRAAIMLDGLDEARGGIRGGLQSDISILASRLTTSKVIVSCRTGDYVSTLEQFDLMEICALSAAQIYQIAEFWLEDARPFMAALKALPYYDVVDRPLLLVQLLFIYKKYGYLPSQPAQVYRRLVSTLLHEWDAERGVTRSSSYADFNAERKAEFLAALSYELTYRMRTRSFTEADMIMAYAAICERFALPTTDANKVVEELESHTGIVTMGSAYTFEFSHLSLQEYLCADYLVRQPISERTWQYLAEYPAPLAVATALSSDPGLWLATVVLNASTKILAEAARGLVTRLVLERPGFSRSEEMGVTLLRLFDVAATDALAALIDLSGLPNVMESIALGLRCFSYKKAHLATSELIKLTRTCQHVGVRKLPVPATAAVPFVFVEQLVERGNDDAVILLNKITREASDRRSDQE